MLQGSLLTLGDPGIDPTVRCERIALDDHSWVDVARGLVRGTEDALAELVAQPGWRTGRRRMYEREVDDPRLMRWHSAEDASPHPLLAQTRAWAAGHYGRPFGGVALNHYRDGNDSVAWHRDRELRDPEHTLVAILTLGARRPFRLRPFGGGSSIDLSPASGDLLVMGGRCQLDWEHAVPKTRRGTGPRVSASWRWSADQSHLRFREDGYFTARTWRPAH